MTSKSARIGYWISLILFCLMMLMDGVSGVMRVEGGQEAMKQLSYPVYLMVIVGAAKILGVIALLQNRFKTLKEWAFAGFAIQFVGASASWGFSHGPVAFVLLPLIMLGVMFIPYYFWKKLERLKTTAVN